MTKVYRRTSLPALDNSKPVQNPDLLNLADKNYASTIMRYSNLAILYSQLDTESKTIVGAINELKKDVPYILPPATTSTLGGVIVGDNLHVTNEGVISADAQELTPATTETLGGVIVGDYLNVTSDGTLSVDSSAVGKTYYSGTLTTIDNSNKINVNMTKSTVADIEQESIDHPNVLYFTEGNVTAGTVIKTTTATLLANNWTNTSQTVTVSGITATCHLLVSSAPTNYQAYTISGVYASASVSNSITFSCIKVPEVNLVVNIAYWEDVT